MTSMSYITKYKEFMNQRINELNQERVKIFIHIYQQLQDILNNQIAENTLLNKEVIYDQMRWEDKEFKQLLNIIHKIIHQLAQLLQSYKSKLLDYKIQDQAIIKDFSALDTQKASQYYLNFMHRKINELRQKEKQNLQLKFLYQASSQKLKTCQEIIKQIAQQAEFSINQVKQFSLQIVNLLTQKEKELENLYKDFSLMKKFKQVIKVYQDCQSKLKQKEVQMSYAILMKNRWIQQKLRLENKWKRTIDSYQKKFKKEYNYLIQKHKFEK